MCLLVSSRRGSRVQIGFRSIAKALKVRKNNGLDNNYIYTILKSVI